MTECISHKPRSERTSITILPCIGTPLFSKTDPQPLPVTKRLSKSLLSLPIQPEVARAAAERIAQAIREFISK